MVIKKSDIENIVLEIREMVKEKADWATIVTTVDIRLKTLLEKDNQSKPEGTITAVVHTDDYVAKADFVADRWFGQATDEEILSLANCQ